MTIASDINKKRNNKKTRKTEKLTCLKRWCTRINLAHEYILTALKCNSRHLFPIQIHLILHFFLLFFLFACNILNMHFLLLLSTIQIENFALFKNKIASRAVHIRSMLSFVVTATAFVKKKKENVTEQTDDCHSIILGHECICIWNGWQSNVSRLTANWLYVPI